MRRRDVVGVVAALAIAAVCARLGFWQLDRLAQRRARNVAITTRLALPPLDLAGEGRPAAPGGVGGGGVSADSARGRRVRAWGVYDFPRERVWPGRSFDGTPGVALVTPLRLPGGSAVLVDRGWVPSPDAYHVNHEVYRESDTAVVEGLGVVPPRGLGDVDPIRLRDSLPYPLLPFVVQQLGPAPPALTGLPRRWPPPTLGNGPHLSYAIQWFSFAVIIVVGTVALLRKASATISGRF